MWKFIAGLAVGAAAAAFLMRSEYTRHANDEARTQDLKDRAGEIAARAKHVAIEAREQVRHVGQIAKANLGN